MSCQGDILACTVSTPAGCEKADTAQIKTTVICTGSRELKAGSHEECDEGRHQEADPV